jgi:TonB family protein
LLAQEGSADGDEKVPPTLIKKTEPEYTEKARKDGISGSVLLSLIVDENGIPKDIKVLSPLADGLDQKAVEAVMKWRFKPGTHNGVPVEVAAKVSVSFRLCVANCGPDPNFARLEGARTTYNLAVHQLRGDLDTKRDEKAAFQSLQKAAAMDFGPAETLLGQLYSAGVGTVADNGKAAEWFDRAAFNGDADGEYELGNLYRSGTGVPRDAAFALKLFTRAAEKDQAAAEYALGRAFEAGEGTPADLPQASKWYRKSAEQGFSRAQYRLATLYWSGSAGKQDQVAALTWALLAEGNGAKEASADVLAYRAAMTSGRIAEAEKRAGRFKPRGANLKK